MIIIYTLVENKEKARLLSRTLVEEKLAACVNFTPNVQSVFFWDNQVQESEEVAILIKTIRDFEDTVYKRIKEIHTYECPAIFTVNVDKTDPNFFNWLLQQQNMVIN